MTETTYLVTVTHNKPLPEIFQDVLAARAYDWLTAKNVKVDVQAKEWTRVEEVAA
jgi:hypothetical protein